MTVCKRSPTRDVACGCGKVSWDPCCGSSVARCSTLLHVGTLVCALLFHTSSLTHALHCLLQLKDETERSKEEHEEMKQQVKRQREHEKKWESTRETRVGTWREYMNKGSKKASSHIKPPKQKTFDDDKTYVQRPVGEQHRPPPPKPAGPKK